MHPIRSLRLLPILLWCAFAPIAAAAPPEVPPDLRDWSGWVLHEHEYERCPRLPGQRVAHLCAWPGRLELSAEAGGAEFAQTWEVLEWAQEIPLPGDARWRPEAVTADGRAAPVLLRGDRPVLYLAPGSHRITGRIVWERRPAGLAVPEETALIGLRVDGRPIERIERDDGVLVLGEADRHEADSLDLEVARLLADGVPGVLLTHLQLSVAGRPREMRLGPALPAGYAPMAIGGDLPARLDADGRLRVQLRPGSWELTVAARALSPLEAFSIAKADAPWPEQEVLQFRPDPRFRLAQLRGLAAVDPQQVSLPDWDYLGGELFDEQADAVMPADPDQEMQTLLIAPGETGAVEVRQRGLPEAQPPQLSLQRTLWLDFDGSGYSALDRIQGEAGSLRRLDLAEPWRLQRANWAGRDWLLTRSPDGGQAGVEIRPRQLDVAAAARLEEGAVVSGWTQPFSSAAFTLNLPPGYRLLAATGAERAFGSWWDAWSLLDIFLVSLAALLAWRLGRRPLLALAIGYALLAWHEPGAPTLGVLAALALALAMAALPGERWLKGARLALAVILALILLAGLPFATTQIKLALHPQLEYAEVGSGYYPPKRGLAEPPVVFEEPAPMAIEAPAPAAPPPPAPTFEAPRTEADFAAQDRKAKTEGASLDRVEVTGARLRRAELYSYPADAIPQAGAAMPGWSWQRHELIWNGPLLPADDLGLWLSPPWVTRLWRLLSVLLLAGLLGWLARTLRPAPGPVAAAAAGTSAGALAALLLPLCLALPPAPAQAQTPAHGTPDPALLDALRQRLLERREPCQPRCVAAGPVTVTAAGRRIVVTIEAQAQAEGLLRLPRPDADTVLAAVQRDGAAVPVRRAGGDSVLRVPAGVHQVRAEFAAAGRASLSFPDAPARVRVEAPGYLVSGLDEGRLRGDTLTLSPPQPVAAADPVGAPQPVPPLVRVLRAIELDREWTVRTTVQRLAPAEAGFEVAVGLLAGERILDQPPPLEGGKARIDFAAGAASVSWTSRLQSAATLSLAAAEQTDYVEQWRIDVSPLLHATYRDLPLSLAEQGVTDADGGWYFLPLPGEGVELEVSRPAAVEGPTLALENVHLQSRPGRRAAEHQLGFSLRATRAGDYRLALPEGAELLALNLDGHPQPRLLSEGAVVLPVAVGTRQVDLSWRQAGDRRAVLATPKLELGASSADLRIALELPQDRWLLWLTGPGVGPAVLLWSRVVLLIGLAWALARWGGTPLRRRDWLLLGLGFATVSWAAAALIAGWLLALGWRGRQSLAGVERRRFNLLQVALALLTVLALQALLIAIPAGLLGRPDMGVSGNGSTAATLRWFLDRSAEGALPAARAYTMPLWLYKAALLAWSLWLAQALLRWLRWGWQCFGFGGAWRGAGG